MLSRRHLRIKVMQALYSYFQSPAENLESAEKQLFNGVEKIYDLYLYLLLLIPELAEQARISSHTVKNFPKKEDLAIARFYDSMFIKQWSQHPLFLKELKDRKISWGGNQELSAKIFSDVKKTSAYRTFLLSSETSFESEKKLLIELFRKHIVSSTHLKSFVEEKNIFWNNSIDWMSGHVIKTLEQIEENSKGNFLLPLYKDTSDKEFIRTLFLQTIIHNTEFETSISDKTKNWEMDRIAMLDVIIMKMTLCELVCFPFIPVKVTMNEYLDIAKEYSTSGSSSFINGIIDKLAADYKTSGKISKKGAGLIG